MKLKTYWRSLEPEEKEVFAERVGTSVGYLHILAGDFRRPGAEMAKKIARASEGKVPLSTLRPDLWGKHMESRC